MGKWQESAKIGRIRLFEEGVVLQGAGILLGRKAEVAFNRRQTAVARYQHQTF